MSETPIPVLTQPCIDVHLRPLGAITVDSEWMREFKDQFSSLVDNIRKEALPGTQRIYNLQWRHRDYHGHTYLTGTADCYALDFEEVETRPRRNVVVSPRAS